MSRPVGRHRSRRDTGIRALRRPAVAATAAISSVTVAAAAYSTASSANASVSGVARANIAAGASTAAFNAANSGVAADAQAQTAAADSAVSARKAADAKARAAAAARATAAAKLQGKAASSAKAAQAAAKKAADAKRAQAPDTSRSATRPSAPAPTYSGNPQAIASAMLSSYGWGQDQMGCLVSLWNRESGWRVGATNPSSGAYGIPQSLPAGKMASAGADWRTNPATQIRWGLGYIKSSYGSPCGAWGHSQATGWY